MRTLAAALAALLMAGSVHADPLDEFKTRVRVDLIKPFARDLGGVLGSASAHTGRSLGLPGFWVGTTGSIQVRPDKDNRVLRDAGVKAFGLPLLEAGVGLPFHVDVIVHGIKAYGASVFGGGVRYGVYRTELLTSFLPNLSVSAFGDKVTHDDFSAVHGALNAAATWNLPIIKPFLVAGYDQTKLTVDAATAAGIAGLSATAGGSRFSLGADIHPLPFISLRGAYTLRHGVPGYDIGLGATF